MNEQQKRFAEYYAAYPNATEAAKQAGYSPRTARSQGQRLLTSVDIQRYIREIQDRAAEKRIMTIAQTKAFWSDIVNDKNEKTANRLKASELLARAAGAFIHTETCREAGLSLIGEQSGEDVIIYLPEIIDESEVTLPPEGD